MEYRPRKFAPSSRLIVLLASLAVLAACRALLGMSEAILLIPLAIVLGLGLFDGIRFYLAPKRVDLSCRDDAFQLKRGIPSIISFSYRVRSEGAGHLESLFLRLPEGFIRRDVSWNHSSRDNREEWIDVSLDALSMKRGVGTVQALFLEMHSPLGLWISGERAEVDWTIRVYPDLMHDDRNLAAFLLRRDMAGITARRRFGLGREFDRLREYQPGDAYSEIFWKASAKCQRPITMVRRVERTQQVYALIDTSRLSGRVADYKRVEGCDPGTVWPIMAIDRFVNGALSLGLAAENQGDLFGLIGFSRYPSLSIKARSGNDHYTSVRNALLDVQADHSHPNYQELFSHVKCQIRSRSLLVVFTHFDDVSMLDRFIESVRIVARQHLVVAVSIRPDNVQPLFSPGAEAENVEDVYRAFTSHLSWEVLESARKRLSRYGIRLLVTSQASLCSKVITNYVNIKERQLG